VVASLNGLARLYADQSQFTKAEPLYKRALLLQFDITTSDHDAQLQEAVFCYTDLLRKMGFTPAQIGAQVREIVDLFGNDIGQVEGWL